MATESPTQPAEQIATALRQASLDEFVEVPAVRNRASRGAILGVVLGAGVWAVILVATGLIKL